MNRQQMLRAQAKAAGTVEALDCPRAAMGREEA